jgi:hypothetical protein
VAVGIILALIIVAAIIIGAVWFMRTRRMLGRKSSGGVAFENPSYLREVNMDHIQASGEVKTFALPLGLALCCGCAFVYSLHKMYKKHIMGR